MHNNIGPAQSLGWIERQPALALSAHGTLGPVSWEPKKVAATVIASTMMVNDSARSCGEHQGGMRNPFWVFCADGGAQWRTTEVGEWHDDATGVLQPRWLVLEYLWVTGVSVVATTGFGEV